MDENEIADLIDDLKSAGFPCIVVLGDNDSDDDDRYASSIKDEIEDLPDDEDDDQGDEIEESDDE